nr:threonine synthase [Treponema sp.]
AKELFVKYNVFADHSTASAYAAVLKKKSMIGEDDGTVVLVMRDHPSLDSDFIRQCIGEVPEMPENVKSCFTKINPDKPCASSVEEILKIIQTVHESF